MFLFITPRLFWASQLALFARLTMTGRILLLTAVINLLVGSVSANAEVSELINSKCETRLQVNSRSMRRDLQQGHGDCQPSRGLRPQRQLQQIRQRGLQMSTATSAQRR
jgi:hypothetical protein